MGIEFIILVCLLAIIVLIIIFVYIRDSDVSRRLGIFERSIEDLSRQNHELKKIFSEKESQSKNFSLSENLKIQIEKEIKNKLSLMQNSLDEVEQITKEYHSKQGPHEESLSENIDYEKEVLELYKSGETKESIAAILHMNEGEVNMILKLSDYI